MRKKILLFASLFLFTQTFGQKNLRSLINSPTGVSKHFTTLTANQQTTFSVADAATVLGLDIDSRLVLKNQFSDKLGFLHYRFYQTWKGIPIENSMYLIHTKNGKIQSMNGEIVVDFDLYGQHYPIASLSPDQAVNYALAQVNAKQYAWQFDGMEQNLKAQTKNNSATYKPTAQLVWYNAGDAINPRALTLAYKVDVYAIQPLSRADYFIDAQSGKMLGKNDKIYFSDATGTAQTAWSGTQTIHSDYTGTNYRLRDITKGSGVITVHGETSKRGNDYTSSTANWTLPGSDIAALDAHWGVSETYDFYYLNFGRNSYDGNGTALYAYVNDPTYLDNAFWDGSSMNFNKRSNGDPGGVTAIDVCAHELTHGVTQTTSNLTYAGESGGMNESLSDIMGKSVQFWSKPTDINWLISNDMNWAIRDMSNPKAFQQPDTYKGQYWSNFADVHTLSGVGNYMYYLLENGGSGTNDNNQSYNVTGVGLDKAIQIIYRSNLLYLSANSKYRDWRTACITAATDLYGASSNEVTQVMNSWYAVGVDSTGGTTCTKPAGLNANPINSTDATLNWGAVTSAVSYNLQWKPTLGSSWTTVSGLTTNSYQLTGLNAATSYDFKVQTVCAGSVTSNYSSTSTFVTDVVGGYCYSHSSSSSYEYINSVKFGTRTNTSGDNNGYGDFTSLPPVRLKAGQQYTIELQAGFSGSTYSEYFTLFIDYNGDRDFGDAGEKVGTVMTSSTTAVSITFTVPANAKNGLTMLRVQMQYGSASTDPCATLSYGEVEDYSSRISGGTEAIAATAAADASANKLSGITVAPNPVISSSASFTYTVAQTGTVVLQLTDISGNARQTIRLGNKTAGTYTYTGSDVNKLPAGNYMAVLQQNGQLVARTHFVVSK